MSTQNKAAKEIQLELAAPFMQTIAGKQYPAIKWLPKALTAKKDKFFCFAYLDREMVINRLNDVFGINGWQFSVIREEDGTKTGTLSCLIEGDWISRSDTGTKSQTEAEKGSTSDALKRCATQFGVGTYIYSMPNKFINAKLIGSKSVPVDNTGRPLYGDQVSAFLNGMSVGQGLMVPLLTEFPHLFQRAEIKALWDELKS